MHVRSIVVLSSRIYVWSTTVLQEDYVHVDRWLCRQCKQATTISPEQHQLIAHTVKTEYFRCPGCEHVDVVAMSFLTHLMTHEYRTERLDNCWEVDLPPVTRFHACRYQPTCLFQTGTLEKLVNHYVTVHAQRPAGAHPSRFPPPLCPIVTFPPSLSLIAQEHGAKMIGKLYGESTAVVYFTKPVSLGSFSVRNQIGDRLGFAVVRRHPSNPNYKTTADAGSDEKELPRSKVELCDTTRKPWTTPFTISFAARLEDDKSYLLVEPMPGLCHFLMKVVGHSSH